AEPSKTPTSTTELTTPQTPPKAAAPKRTPPAAAAEAFAAPILKTSPAAAPIAEPAATFRSRRVSAAVQDKSKRGSKTGPVLPALPQLPPYLRDLRKRATDGKAELGNVLAKLPAFAKQFTVPKRASAPTPKPTPDDSATRAVPAPNAPARKDAFATLRERGTTKPKASKPKDSEAERLTIFGARNQQIPPSNKAQNALLILGGVSLLLVAVAVWAVYFYARDDMSEIAAPAPTESIIAAPAPELAPDDSIRAIDDIEAALGLEDAAQQLPDDRPELSAQSTGQMDRPVPFAAQDLQGGRAAGLRSVGVIAPRPDAPLPISPAAPPAFAELSQAPLRSELLALEALPEAAASADGLPVENGEALAADTPGEQEQIEIEVIAGTPAAIPPQRPAGLIPEDVLAEITAQAEASLPDAQAQAEAQAETPPILATVATPDETELVIGVTQGRPSAVPPPRPAALAPAAPSTAPTTDAAPDAIEDGNLTSPAEDTATTAQASLASPGGIALSALRPQARPEPLGQTPEAEPTPDAFATATRLAVPRSLRPDARPSQFAAIVERNLAARQVAAAPAAAPAPEPVQTARAAVAAVPAIPTSASVAREATQARAINLRQINLIGVMGTASNRRALVRLSNGNVVAVRVGEALDGGQVTAIGDSELRYIRRGRDVVLRLAS
ncbi:MAG: hypothetical protein LAT78_02480, partial [Roseinatronobacter sp.]|nr:hypothetical protein [Roseinatronobacter sp.]